MKKAVIIVICLLAVVLVPKRTVGRCEIDRDDCYCEPGDWSKWTSCTAQCGNSGERTRSRYHDCIGNFFQREACNRFCKNGGTPQSTYCSCPDGYLGNCCEHKSK